jgi:hypothetical protein
MVAEGRVDLDLIDSSGDTLGHGDSQGSDAA